jgi:alkylation response protein AidB-like acyl-CoA dehydrogenase
LAGADPSVALVSSMHPAVLAFWVANPDPTQPRWEAQRRSALASAAEGVQWGTITSEPGSGGDLAKTKATAVPDPSLTPVIEGDTFRVTGDKHFGSGSGVTQRMMTTAVAEGETDPTIFVLDVDGVPWDGSTGLRLVAEWDGAGMAATQSHAMRLEGMPAVRLAWEHRFDTFARSTSPYNAAIFTSVVLGVLDAAVEEARRQIAGKADTLRAYERVEWARADQDHWLATQAHEGALRALESGSSDQAVAAGLRAKEAVADIAEQSLLRLTRVLGGGTFSGRSPFSHWFEDVRALGFLRPPWGLAYDQLFASSLPSEP